MASNQTANFGLNQWSAEDKVLREEFNADNEKIDKAIAATGNCRIAVGSYVGTGGSGQSNPNVLQLDFSPKIIFMDISNLHTYSYKTYHFILFRGCSRLSFLHESNEYNAVTWGDKTVSWYYTGSGDDAAFRQYNNSGQTYHYIAIG